MRAQIGACLFRAFRALLSADKVSEGAISAAVDDRLTLGTQKMVILTPTQSSFLLDESGLPRFRAVQDADVEEILDELVR